MTYLFAEAYARNAIEGRREACKELVTNYAHVYRKPPKAVLIAISVMLMNPTDYSYADYNKVKRVIIEMMEAQSNNARIRHSKAHHGGLN